MNSRYGIFPFLLLITLSSCSWTQKQGDYYPDWWLEHEEGRISFYGIGSHDQQHIARLAAQNDAFQKIRNPIFLHLNTYVAENCIEPGDEEIQKELDRIFLNFCNYLINLENPEIILNKAEVNKMKVSGEIKFTYFVQMQINQNNLHKSMLNYLKTSDLYIHPSLKMVLKQCFSE
jgi:hypothetical protein